MILTPISRCNVYACVHGICLHCYVTVYDKHILFLLYKKHFAEIPFKPFTVSQNAAVFTFGNNQPDTTVFHKSYSYQDDSGHKTINCYISIAISIQV